MSHALEAPYYALRAVHEQVTILENVQLARDTYRVRLAAPQIARRILPGQFLMLRLEGDDPLLGRPFALYDTVLDAHTHQAVGVDVAYLVVGKMTGRLAQLPAGEILHAWGPLGNGFEPIPTEHLVMVAGGIGQTPFMALAREALALRRYGDPVRAVPPLSEDTASEDVAPRVTLCYGARTQDYLAGIDDFCSLGVRIRISTDDGSHGHHGLVTDLLGHVLDESPRVRVVTCGPEAMMAAVSRQCAQRGVACQVSLETPMACGIGICFSCVAKVKLAEGGWDYRRTCVEGPVFDAQSIEW